MWNLVVMGTNPDEIVRHGSPLSMLYQLVILCVWNCLVVGREHGRYWTHRP